jgi:hypothetical protein
MEKKIEGAKKAYASPRLRAHGNLKTITKGGGGILRDGRGGTAPFTRA